jgi:hypothetical protein
MCPVNLDEIRIDHIVELAKENTTFIAARENSNNHLRIFLVYNSSGNVYTRNGRADSWEELNGDERSGVLACLFAARRDGVAVYKVNGQN